METLFPKVSCSVCSNSFEKPRYQLKSIVYVNSGTAYLRVSPSSVNLKKTWSPKHPPPPPSFALAKPREIAYVSFSFSLGLFTGMASTDASLPGSSVPSLLSSVFFLFLTTASVLPHLWPPCPPPHPPHCLSWNLFCLCLLLTGYICIHIPVVMSSTNIAQRRTAFIRYFSHLY